MFPRGTLAARGAYRCAAGRRFETTRFGRAAVTARENPSAHPIPHGPKALRGVERRAFRSDRVRSGIARLSSVARERRSATGRGRSRRRSGFGAVARARPRARDADDSVKTPSPASEGGGVMKLGFGLSVGRSRRSHRARTRPERGGDARAQCILPDRLDCGRAGRMANIQPPQSRRSRRTRSVICWKDCNVAEVEPSVARWGAPRPARPRRSAGLQRLRRAPRLIGGRRRAGGRGRSALVLAHVVRGEAARSASRSGGSSRTATCGSSGPAPSVPDPAVRRGVRGEGAPSRLHRLRRRLRDGPLLDRVGARPRLRFAAPRAGVPARGRLPSEHSYTHVGPAAGFVPTAALPVRDGSDHGRGVPAARPLGAPRIRRGLHPRRARRTGLHRPASGFCLAPARPAPRRSTSGRTSSRSASAARS